MNKNHPAQEFTPNHPIVDLDYLGLFTEGDSTTEVMMVEAFLNSATDTAHSLRCLCEAQGFESEWRKAAHKLAGSAAQIGARRLCIACQEAETLHSLTVEKKLVMMEDIDCHLLAFQEFFSNRYNASDR